MISQWGDVMKDGCLEFGICCVGESFSLGHVGEFKPISLGRKSELVEDALDPILRVSLAYSIVGDSSSWKPLIWNT
jgi:hypothetical protein